LLRTPQKIDRRVDGFVADTGEDRSNKGLEQTLGIMTLARRRRMERLISINCKKALTVQLGDHAGREIAELIQRLANKVDELEKSKVDVTPIVRTATRSV
jgi:hypothetical protein